MLEFEKKIKDSPLLYPRLLFREIKEETSKLVFFQEETDETLYVRLAGVKFPDTFKKEREIAISFLHKHLKEPINGLILAPYCQEKKDKIATIISSKEININLELIRNGLSFVAKQFLYNCPNPSLYFQTEQEAMKYKKGIWSDKSS